VLDALRWETHAGLLQAHGRHVPAQAHPSTHLSPASNVLLMLCPCAGEGSRDGEGGQRDHTVSLRPHDQVLLDQSPDSHSSDQGFLGPLQSSIQRGQYLCSLIEILRDGEGAT
jgi:hypothetical protein